MRVLGIDEAGRGCVLGPLLIGGFVIEVDREAELWAAGAADSKVLSAKVRLEVRERLVGLGEPLVRRVECAQIDAGNLNRLEEEVICELVRLVQPDRVIIDALGHPSSIPSIVARLKAESESDAEWIMEPKADGTYAAVAAASIFAKTVRDEILEGYAAEFGLLGSGYPSDPETKAWLRAWSDARKPWPEFVRTRWGTIEALKQQSLF